MEIEITSPGVEWRIIQSRRRLTIALWFSAAVVVTAIVLLPLQLPEIEWPGEPDILELRIADEVVEPEQVEPEQRPEETEPVEELVPEPETIEMDPVPDDEPVLVDEAPPSPPIDWYALIDGAVRENSELSGNELSMSPEFDEKRRIARHQFRPSKAAQPKPIWENVEKDMMGRSILRAGDCYRVLDDPNVGTQYVQRTFGQYLVYCAIYPDTPVELPFVAEIVERYAYLQRHDHERGLAVN